MLTPSHPRLSLVPPGTRAQELWVGAAEALGWGLEPWDPRKEPRRARTSCWLEEQAAWGWCLPGNWSCQPVEWVWVLPHPPVYYTRTVTPLLCWLFKSKGIWCWVPSHQPGRDTFPSFFPLDQGQAQRKPWEALHRCSPRVHWYSRFQALMDWEGRWSWCFHIRSRDKQGNLWRLAATPWKPALKDPLPGWPWKFLSTLFLCPQPSFFPPRKAWQNPPRKPRVEVVFLYLLLSGNAWLPSEWDEGLWPFAGLGGDAGRLQGAGTWVEWRVFKRRTPGIFPF